MIATALRDEMTQYWDAGCLAAEAKPGSFYDLKTLGYRELRQLLDTRFEVEVAKGFNGSYYRTFDEVADEAFAERWVKAFEDRPDLATGVILMARPKPDVTVFRATEVEIRHPGSAGAVRRGLGALHPGRSADRDVRHRSDSQPAIYVQG